MTRLERPTALVNTLTSGPASTNVYVANLSNLPFYYLPLYFDEANGLLTLLIVFVCTHFLGS